MKSHYRNMTPDKAKSIRDMYFKGRMKQAAIARTFGITQATVSRIISGKVWNGHGQ